MASLVGNLLGWYENLVQIHSLPNTHATKLGMVVHICSPRLGGQEEGDSGECVTIQLSWISEL